MKHEAGMNPYPPLLPESLMLGELVAGIGSFIKATAWELGERLDAVLAPRFGPNWLYEYFHDVYTPNLHDPDFVLKPQPQDSIIWFALPPYSWDLQDRFKKARWTRNRWEHEAAKQNPSTFYNGVDQIRRLADSLGLSTSAYAPKLLTRVKTLQISGGVLPPSETELELEQQKEQAEQAKAEAAAAADIASAAVKEARQLGAAVEAALLAKRQADEKVAQAEADIRRLEEDLILAAKTNREALTEPADGLMPGEPWGELPLGIRTLTLKANMVDLMDHATQTLLSQQIGESAIHAARWWLETMPAGGQVHLTPAGHAAARVGGRYVYLGRLDNAPSRYV